MFSGDDQVVGLSATGYGFDPATGASIVTMTLYGDGDVTIDVTNTQTSSLILETAIIEAYRSAWESINSQLVTLPSTLWKIYPYQLQSLGGQLISSIEREFVNSFAAPYITLRIRGDGAIDELILSPQINTLPTNKIHTVVAKVFHTAVTELNNRYYHLVANYLALERQQLDYARDNKTQSPADLDGWQHRVDMIETTYRHTTWPIFTPKQNTHATSSTLTQHQTPETVVIPIVIPIDPVEHRTTHPSQPRGRIITHTNNQQWNENPIVDQTPILDQAYEYTRLFDQLHVFTHINTAHTFYTRYHPHILTDHDIVCASSRLVSYQHVVGFNMLGTIIIDPSR